MKNTLMLAYLDWLVHLAQDHAHLTPKIDAGHDKRFTDAAWSVWPFNVYSQSYLMACDWWSSVTTNISGVSPHHENVLNASINLMLDGLSPSNNILLNPQALERLFDTHGASMWAGAQNYLADLNQTGAGTASLLTSEFIPGENIAITPGDVIYRNAMMELIRYAPQSEQVHAEPVLIIPPWIMKYYILDLSPHNSLIKYLVAQGFTVFVVSWFNPTEADRNVGMDDYLHSGLMQALQSVSDLLPEKKIHATGYCLGGTLLTIASALMAREDDDRLASVSLIAAQADFSEPGPLSLFIDANQIAELEHLMEKQGYLDSAQMAATFKLLNANSLIWRPWVERYLLGETKPLSDLESWNADGTRLPYRMHSEYLRHLYLNNDLARSRYLVGNKPVAVSDIQCPMFCLGTEHDTVSPWRSVFKLHTLTSTEITFVLTSGGHNVGIVNPPGVANRHYSSLRRLRNGKYVDPDTWLNISKKNTGSWWPCWAAWLASKSTQMVSAADRELLLKRLPSLDKAPGSFVLKK